MSSIDRLISKHCPDGVPLVAIGDFAELVRGNGMPKSDFVDDGVGCIHYGQIYTYYGTVAHETISFVPEEKAARLAKVDHGDLIVTNTSENLDDVCTAVAWLGPETIVTGGHATVVKHGENPEYLAYVFQTEAFHRRKNRFATGTKVMDVSAKNLARIEVPLPPRAVQDQIVDVLSAMERLEAELEAELEARRQQYEFYRDSLLSFQTETPPRWTRLSDLGTIGRGRRFTKADLRDEGLDALHFGELYTRYDTFTHEAISKVDADLHASLRFAAPGDLIIAGVSETVEDIGRAIAWLGDGPVAVHDDCFFFSHELNPKFAAYYFQTRAFHAEKARHVARGKIKRLSANALASLSIPVPSRNRQDAIVETLDQMHALVNDLGSGLPAEIGARRQQYEYYRDRLLAFEPA